MDFFPQPTTDAILVQCDHFDGPPSDLSEQYFRSNVAWLVPMDMAKNISVQQVPLRLDSYFLVVKKDVRKGNIFIVFFSLIGLPGMGRREQLRPLRVLFCQAPGAPELALRILERGHRPRHPAPQPLGEEDGPEGGEAGQHRPPLAANDQSGVRGGGGDRVSVRDAAGGHRNLRDGAQFHVSNP